MKRILSIILFVAACNAAVASQNKNDSYEYFIGVNPIAPLTSIPSQFTNLYLPLLSNLETGLAFNAGIILRRNIVESRVSIGKPNQLYWLFQFHSGYNYILAGKENTTGFYIGGFIKYYHLVNNRNAIRHTSIIPYLSFGYRIEKGDIFLDFRLNQNIYAVSWSNQENTSIHSNFHFSVYDDISPVLPYLSITIGYVFKDR